MTPQELEKRLIEFAVTGIRVAEAQPMKWSRLPLGG
jgi:hypothetical protein